MGPLAIGTLSILIAGAFVSWIIAAIYGLRVLAALESSDRTRLSRFAIVAWPFASNRFKGTANANAAIVNKAIVAFFICMTLAAATVSLSTNFNRIAK